uniref:uncharacterized protein n=1 Tax=Myxine glutinosa TaxID=7769 RepID=UPI00358DDE7F
MYQVLDEYVKGYRKKSGKPQLPRRPEHGHVPSKIYGEVAFMVCFASVIDGESGDIARSRYHIHAGIDFSDIPPSAGYHPTCYRRFTDKKRQLASKKRCLHAFEGATKVSAVDACVEKPGVLLSPKKSLRSRSALPISSQGHILPRICIICKKESRYLNRVHGPKRDKLVQAETLTAGRLIEAAKLKKDESILVHTRRSDCVAGEVSYHKLCFVQYTRFLSEDRGPAVSTPQNESILYEEAYRMLCQDVIQTRIINNGGVFRLTKLVDTFTKIVKKHHGVILSNMRFLQACANNYCLG